MVHFKILSILMYSMESHMWNLRRRCDVNARMYLQDLTHGLQISP